MDVIFTQNIFFEKYVLEKKLQLDKYAHKSENPSAPPQHNQDENLAEYEQNSA